MIEPHIDYFTMVFALAKVNFKTLEGGFFLTFMRIVPVISFAPFLGSKLSTIVKVGLALSFTLILLPKSLQTLSGPIYFDINYIVLAIKELAIGFGLSFIISLPFYVAQTSGSLIDFLRGSSSLMVQDPFSQSQNSPLSLIYNYSLIILFFQLGGMPIVIEGLMNSFVTFPIDGLISQDLFNSNNPFWILVFGSINYVLALGIQFAAPSIMAILMTELFLGICNRLAPNVQISFLGQSLKALVGLVFLALSWLLIAQKLGEHMQTVLNKFLEFTLYFK